MGTPIYKAFMLMLKSSMGEKNRHRARPFQLAKTISTCLISPQYNIISS